MFTSTLILQFMGMYAGTRLMNIPAKAAGLLALTLIPTVIGTFVPGWFGFLFAFVIFYIILNKIDSETNVLKAVGLVVISFIVQLIVVLILADLIDSLFN